MNPFASIKLPDEVELTEEECAYWSGYFVINVVGGEGHYPNLSEAYKKVTPELITRLLSAENWQTRSAAAFFAALRRYTWAEEHIGRLLLRSDMSFAGRDYCRALATFNTPESLCCLCHYLDYYLTRPDLTYEQPDAYGAVAYLDKINGTHVLKRFKTLRHSYMHNAKRNPATMRLAVSKFADNMAALDKWRHELESDQWPPTA